MEHMGVSMSCMKRASAGKSKLLGEANIMTCEFLRHIVAIHCRHSYRVQKKPEKYLHECRDACIHIYIYMVVLVNSIIS